MYVLAQSGTPTKKVGAGRYGEDDERQTPVPENWRVSTKTPPLRQPMLDLSLEVSRDQTVGDLKPVDNSETRISFTSSNKEASSRSGKEPMPSKQHIMEYNSLFVPKPLEYVLDFRPEISREAVSPPGISLCHLSRASSISEISFNERDWIIDDYSSDSEYICVQRNMVSAKDWEGIILAASCHDHEPGDKVGSFPCHSKFKEEKSHTRQSTEPENSRSIKGTNTPTHRHQGGICRENLNAIDRWCGPEISDDSFHAPLSPPQRRPSLPPKPPPQLNRDIYMDIDLREFARKNAHLFCS
ncbi:hypothetical protein IV203_019739 [Nitzschia inconspicua]|uniref:Uncharacterized protein n=1 Tax=Nitzschia inconspicua TaxID=303405 RepID=A0A9K3LZV5_9STRA|nr:hypothetical protein IV203_019739 [Nitzschia inconspicua]